MTFRLAHVSDLHLTGHAREQPLLESIFISCRDHSVDHVVVTGDVSQNGEHAAFRMLDELRKEHGYGPRRSTVVIGNHDIPGRRAFAWRFGGGRTGVRELDGGNLCLITLDSAEVAPGFPSAAHDPRGFLDDDELEELDDTLSSYDGRRVIVALHHHVFRTPTADQSALMRLGKYLRLWGPLENVDDLLEILGRHGVRLVLTGHSHTSRSRTLIRGGTPIRCIIGGSTIEPGDPDDDEAPGTAYDYGIFDFRRGLLVSTDRVDICDECWERKLVYCECDEPAACARCCGQGVRSCNC